MGTHLDLDDACAGHPEAQAELATLRAQAESLERGILAGGAAADLLRARVAELEALLAEMGHTADPGLNFDHPTTGEPHFALPIHFLADIDLVFSRKG